MNAQPPQGYVTRELEKQDLPAATAIFNAAAKEDENTFGHKPWSVEQLSVLLCGLPRGFGALTCHEGDQLVGWAALIPHHEREAYRPTAELLLYVRDTSRRRGVGRRLASAALTLAREHGFHSVVVLLFSDVPFKKEFARSLGFAHRGALKQVYARDGQWLDLEVEQLNFQTRVT